MAGRCVVGPALGGVPPVAFWWSWTSGSLLPGVIPGVPGGTLVPGVVGRLPGVMAAVPGPAFVPGVVSAGPTLPPEIVGAPRGIVAALVGLLIV